MADQQVPFTDVEILDEGFSIPDLKWRELLFIGALKADGSAFVRDPSRFLPPFLAGDLFPSDARFSATRAGKRVVIRRLPGL